MNITNEFCTFELVPVTNFSLLIFWTKSAQKWYFQSKTQKMYPTIECSAYLNLGTEFQLTWYFDFVDEINKKKGVSC